MKTITTKFLALFALVAFLTTGANTFARTTNPNAPHDSPPDVEFLDMMTMHHEQGIEMARIAEQKAQLPRLKEFASKTIADQEQEIQRMQDVRNRLFANVSKADKMRMGAKAMTMGQMDRMSKMDMQKLEAASGREFDHMFLDIFIKHHQMALQMSRNELARGEQQEVKDMARETTAKQTKDIAEMRVMLRQVGGGTRARAQGRRRA